MRFSALADLASRHYANGYEAEALSRHMRRQAFIASEIEQLTPIKKILIAAEELTEAA